MAVRICRVTHQHALVALLRFHALKLLLRHHDTGLRNIGHFHPVAPQVCTRERLAAHQVMSHEHVLLLEADEVVVALFLHSLYLPVRSAHAYLAAHAPHLVYQQLKHVHHLTHRQFVHNQVRQSVLIHTQFPAPVRQAPAGIVPAAEQLLHHSRQQLRVALAVNKAVLLLAEHHALLKGYPPLRAVIAFPAQKFLLAPSCRKQIVVRR